MTRFSANLGFLWANLPLPDAIRAAKAAGFDAVECHWPYDTPARQVRQVLDQTGLPMLGLNTLRGRSELGENGLSALPDRVTEARAAIDRTIAYARDIRAGHVHVMAGVAAGQAAHDTFVANLRHACDQGACHGLRIVIEPLNRFDAPGYFLADTDQARAIVAQVAAPNLRLMFDCYHVARMQGDVIDRLRDLMPIIGHIQFAGVPDRGPPDQGTLDFAPIFAEIAALSYNAPLGAEYRPGRATEDTLGWMKTLRAF